MMGTKEPMIDGDEYDALTKARKFYRWRAGMIKKVKRQFWKRTRKRAKVLLERGQGG